MKPFDALQVPLLGTCLVEASAGTGKTYAISTLFVRHLLESGLSIGQILVVTFTEAATAELRDRIRRRLQETVAVCEALDSGACCTNHDATLVTLIQRQGHRGLARRALLDALLHFDNAAIYTIHGFCQRVLRENAFSTRAPFDAEVLQDVRPMVDDLLTDFWLSRLYNAPFEVVRGLHKRGLGPHVRDVVKFANFVASTTQVELLPKGNAAAVPLQHGRAEEAFLKAKHLFDRETLTTLCTPVYPNQNHLQGRLDALEAYFERGYGELDLPRQKAEWFFPQTLATKCQKKKGAQPPEHAFFDAIRTLADECAALESCIEQHVLGLKKELVAFVQREMAERKARRGLLSFDDLLQQLFHALRSSEGQRLAYTLRARYRAALIDEFQDTDPVQYNIFHSIFDERHGYDNGGNSLFLIGDPKQAIYSFRGADVFAYMEAAKRVAETHRFTMTTNHRSDEQLVRAVNALFEHRAQPFFYRELPYPSVRAIHAGQSRLSSTGDSEACAGALEFRFIAREPSASKPYARHAVQSAMSARVAAGIADLLASDTRIDECPLSPKHIAVLTRTNREAFDCQRALAQLGVPSVVQGDRSVYEQPEASDLQFVLAAAAEPGRSSSIRTALATDLLGLSASDLQALETDEELWDTWVERFQSYAERWRNDGFIQMIRQLLLECGVTQRLLISPTGERRMTNVLHLVELLHTQAISEHLGPSGLLQYLREQRARNTTATENEQVRLESDEDAVVLTTIHKSKGLEYPITVCPYLFSSAQPVKSSQWVDFHDADTRQLYVDLGSERFDYHAELKTQESISENLRLLYVALTRARHRCIVYWGALQNFNESALSYLLYGATGASESAATDLKCAGDQELLAPLQALHEKNLGLRLVIERPLTVGEEAPETLSVPNTVAASPARLTPPLAARQAKIRVQRWLRTASFTELTRHAPSVPGATSPASDHDELLQSEDIAAADEGAIGLSTTTTLATFPRGATVGNFFHYTLEHADFEQEPDLERVRQSLAAHGLGLELADQALAGLLDALQTPFAPDLSLSKIPTGNRLNELEFTFPVGSVASESMLTSNNLADAFRKTADETAPSAYADAVAGLPFVFLQGFLRGFIDLVFVHDGRWYLVDYKTNHLGDSYADYVPSALLDSMQRHHYVLQYHLYGLALHRYLMLRLPDYDYARDFGGVYYLFLRGMNSKLGAETGVFFDKPTLARLDALSTALGTPLQSAKTSGLAGVEHE